MHYLFCYNVESFFDFIPSSSYTKQLILLYLETCTKTYMLNAYTSLDDKSDFVNP